MFKDKMQIKDQATAGVSGPTKKNEHGMLQKLINYLKRISKGLVEVIKNIFV